MTDVEAAVILRNWVEAFETDGLYRTAEAVQRAVDALEREAQWVDDEGAAIAVERANVLGASKIHRPLKDKYQTWPKDAS